LLQWLLRQHHITSLWLQAMQIKMAANGMQPRS
jgi:hypothetical protein